MALGVLTADCAPVLFYDPVGRGHRRRTWRLARRARRRRRGDRRADGSARRRASPHPGGDRPVHRPALLRGRAGVSAAISRRGPGERVDFFAPAPRQGHFFSISPGYIERRLVRAGVATVEIAPTRHGRRGGTVLQLSARLPAWRTRLRPRTLGNRARGAKALTRRFERRSWRLTCPTLRLCFCFGAARDLRAALQ